MSEALMNCKWKIGQSVDILDNVNSVYCPGVVVAYKDRQVVVRYKGWGDEWDEALNPDGKLFVR